jgi:hypothetical protein
MESVTTVGFGAYYWSEHREDGDGMWFRAGVDR